MKETKLRGYSKVWHGRLLRNIDNMNERTEYERAKVLTNYKPI